MPEPAACDARIEGDRLLLGMVDDTASIAAGQAALRAFLAQRGASARGAFQTELAFEELVTNVARHAYAGRLASRSAIAAVIELHEDEIVLTVDDDGPPFDPVAAPELPLATDLEQARVGGLGIRFIRAAAARISHERVAGRNRTTVWLTR